MRAPTGRGLASSSTLTNTRCEFSVTVRSPVVTSSPHTRTPTSTDEVPTYSTWAFRMAICPTLTGWRKSMSSMTPRTTVPWATRAAAIVPAWVIHCIIRPPWICPGAPACSGNTHWIISVTVSAIDGIGLKDERPRVDGGGCATSNTMVDPVQRAWRPVATRVGAVTEDGRRRAGGPIAGEPAPCPLRRQGGDAFQDHALQAVEAGGMQSQVAHLGAGDGPHEAHVDREPGQLVGQQPLGALVEPGA